MFSTVTSGAVFGIRSYLMQVEVDVTSGLPVFNMVGLLSTEVREAGERVRVALRNSGIEIPPKHITVNFSPADIRKNGVGIDLPVALGILVSTGCIEEEALKDTVVLGELGLDGEVKKIRGVLPVVAKAKEEGYKTCILPYENAGEGAVIRGMKIVGVRTLRETFEYLSAEKAKRDSIIEPVSVDVDALFDESLAPATDDFADVNGQAAVKRAAEISAAGFHHLLMVGPPGSGKSMIAKRIPGILPPLSESEALEVSTIYSVSGMLKGNKGLITRRPFMSPHHSITETALAGGGNVPRPGVISLAHRGVLFLDELAEFSHSTLDMMRQPLEDRSVHIARNRGTFVYPADCILVSAMNPCPCGYYPDRNRCRCTPRQIIRYLSHVSGPILDRIDICVEAPRISVEELSSEDRTNESSAAIRERVLGARAIQEERFKDTTLRFNSDMGPAHIKEFCRLGRKESTLMERIFHKMNLSARSYHRIIKVARTIADLEGAKDIKEAHITEASCYRIDENKYWNV